jgi:hypothetical protein
MVPRELSLGFARIENSRITIVFRPVRADEQRSGKASPGGPGENRYWRLSETIALATVRWLSVLRILLDLAKAFANIDESLRYLFFLGVCHESTGSVPANGS